MKLLILCLYNSFQQVFLVLHDMKDKENVVKYFKIYLASKYISFNSIQKLLY